MTPQAFEASTSQLKTFQQPFLHFTTTASKYNLTSKVKQKHFVKWTKERQTPQE